MSKPIWVEAAINGPWGKERQPGIPVAMADIVADGIAAVEAGAAIVHLHVYDEATGRQRDDWELYARAIEGIRARVDAIVYPTIPILGSGYAGDMLGSGRYTHLAELAKRGLVEWGVLDPGSCNWLTFAGIPAGETGFIYQNPGEHIREGMAVAQAYRIHPSYAIYEPGFTRLGAALAAAYPGLPTPIYRLMFSDDFAWGFPPRIWALEAHLKLLEEAAPGAPAMIAGLGVDVSGLIGAAVARGVHLRTGLEDVPFGCTSSNAALVAAMVGELERQGGRPASVAEVRAELAGKATSA
ncbi:3-keto-5-aminohexanoate cleavage protein [Bosea sp. TWI1241]|uniref:3-keto-5-aminohexanoate cleavage protein n=1 Tax=Bosea sp. TWI1241 TaxID=3148904 RepID=UPI00320A43FD